MSLRGDAERLARKTEAAIVRLYQRRESLTEAQFVRMAATILAAARIRGVMLADLSLADDVRRALGGQRSLIGLQPPEEAGGFNRLEDSVRTVLSTDVDSVSTPEERAKSVSSRLARLGRDVPAEAVAYGMRQAMLRRSVPGWTRQTDTDPCQVCRNLADGVARSPTVTMIRHTGCMCVPSPVF